MLSTENALSIIDGWRQAEWLRPIDASLARFLHRETSVNTATGNTTGYLLIAAALASHQLGRGHGCLDLRATLSDPTSALSLPPQDASHNSPDNQTETDTTEPVHPSSLFDGLDLAQWRAALSHPMLIGDGESLTPLILESDRVYLRRYWGFEQAVANGIRMRLAQPPVGLPIDITRNTLAVLFPERPPKASIHWQKIACALAARSRFSIITGGPGTGKTTTVLRMLALLQAVSLQQTGEILRIRLAAPTGKAAARLNESILSRIDELPLEALGLSAEQADAIPRSVSTLHRLLGRRLAGRQNHHHAGRPLPADVLVIDEASMVDLEMMAAVLDALPANAQLILLGDKDQLASVEAGAVLGELCQRAECGYYNADTARWLAEVTGENLPPEVMDTHKPAGSDITQSFALDQSITVLRESHRFSEDSPIGQLATAIKNGEAPAISSSIDLKNVGVHKLIPEGPTDSDLKKEIVAGYTHYLSIVRSDHSVYVSDLDSLDRWAGDVLTAHREFQVLTALRNGPWGVAVLNERIAQWLSQAGLINGSSAWYVGRPVMVTRNNYALGLMNGDVGIALPVPYQPTNDNAGVIVDRHNQQSKIRVAFPSSDAERRVRWVSPLRLADAQTVYAMTVHKSQGSEFTHVALTLPPSRNPLVTRELLYTGITRAREQVTLILPGGMHSLTTALGQCVQRASGLSERIWQ